MNTVNFSHLLRGVQELWKGTNDLPGTADYPIVRDLLSLSLREIWMTEYWPELMAIEKRLFRPIYVAGTYAQSVELWDAATQEYYQSLIASNTAAPTVGGVENSAYWALCRASYSGDEWVTATSYAVGKIVHYDPTDDYYQCHTAHTSSGTLTPVATGADKRWGILNRFIPSIDFDQTDKTEIGDVYAVYDNDPRVDYQYEELDFFPHGTSIIVRDDVQWAWVHFQLRPPELTGSTHATTTTYALDDQAYYETGGAGNMYRCIVAAAAGELPTDTGHWSVIEIPRRFAHYLIWAAYAKVPKLDPDRQNWAQAQAESYLNLEKNRLGEINQQWKRPLKAAMY